MDKLKKISESIGIRYKYLQSIIGNVDKFYYSYYLKKKNGKNRIIDSPNSELKAIQAWILRNILEKIEININAVGFVKGKGIKVNADYHVNNRYILCIDIKDFFNTIKISKVFEVFKKYYNYKEDETSSDLSKLCTYKGYLPQGAVTSPALSNIIFKQVDDEIEEICNSLDVCYSRYADDLSFSNGNVRRLEELKTQVEKILNKNGYFLNTKKTRLLRGAGRKAVTGIILNSGRPTIGRERKRIIRSMIYNYLIKKEKSVNVNQLLGYLAFLRDIEPQYYEKMISYKKNLTERL